MSMGRKHSVKRHKDGILNHIKDVPVYKVSTKELHKIIHSKEFDKIVDTINKVREYNVKTKRYKIQ